MSLFVDTSVWYAAADSDDRSNGRAREILLAGDSLVTTDQVLVETWTLLRRRIHRSAAEAFWRGLRSGVAALKAVGSADGRPIGPGIDLAADVRQLSPR